MKKSLKMLALIFLLWGGSMFRQGGFAFAQSLQIGSNFVILPNSAASPTCAVADKGKQYFNTTDNKMYFCNGMAWVDFSVGAFALPYSGNGNSAGVAFQIQQTGTSAAGNFVITNSSNSINALIGQTNCTGFAGRFNSSNATPKPFKPLVHYNSQA